MDEADIGFEVERFRKLTEEEKLYRRLRVLADSSLAYRMRKTLPDVIPVFSEELLGKVAETLFLQIFKTVEEDKLYPEECRNKIRQLLEAYVHASVKLGILDQQFAFGEFGPTLGPCSIFMSGRTLSIPRQHPTHTFKAKPNIFPKSVSESFGYLVRCTHAGSHFSETDNSNLYLLKSLYNALNLILSWLQKFATDHADPGENRKSIQVEKTS